MLERFSDWSVVWWTLSVNLISTSLRFQSVRDRKQVCMFLAYGIPIEFVNQEKDVDFFRTNQQRSIFFSPFLENVWIILIDYNNSLIKPSLMAVLASLMFLSVLNQLTIF